MQRFRKRLDLPGGRITAAVHTFGDYLIFHPHLRVFAAAGLLEKLSTHTHSMKQNCLILPGNSKKYLWALFVGVLCLIVVKSGLESVKSSFYLGLASGILGLIIPWVFLLASRKAAATCSFGLSLIASISFLMAEIQLAGEFRGDKIRLDLVIFPPLLGLDWLVFIGLAVAAAMKSPPAGPKDG